MGLLYVGDETFQQSGPENWISTPFELDQLVIPYEGGLDLLDAILALLAVGESYALDSNMKLQRWQTSTPRPGVAQIELIYIGAKGGVLPDVKHDQGNAVMSASSKRTSNGTILAEPATVQYYAPARIISYFTADAPGTDVAADPVGDPGLISYTFGDTTFAVGLVIQEIIDVLFMPQIIQTLQSEEIIPGEYWRNVSRKTKVLSPWIYTLTPGPYVSLAAAGTGYTVGNTLNVNSGGETASITITSIGVAGSITGWTESSDTFTVPHDFLPASGGTGSGAQFNVRIIA